MRSGFMLAVILLVPIPVAALGGLGPLVEVQGVDRAAATMANGPGVGAMVEQVYRNEGNRAVTAYDHRCVVATQDGRTGWTGSAEEAFPVLRLPYGPEREAAIADAFVAPGETIEVRFGNDWKRDGPFAFQTCGLVGLILEDGSSYGDPEILEELFTRRRAWVADMQRVATGLQEVVDDLFEHDPPQALAEALRELPAAALYGPEVEEILDRSRREGRVPIADLRALRDRAHRNFLDAREHLRPQDRSALREELGEGVR